MSSKALAVRASNDRDHTSVLGNDHRDAQRTLRNRRAHRRGRRRLPTSEVKRDAAIPLPDRLAPGVGELDFIG